MALAESHRLIRAIMDTGLNPPGTLYLMITSGCNLHCRHCWPQAVPLKKATWLAPQDVAAVVDNFTRLGITSLCITGGEPLSHPDLDAMVRCAALRPELKRIELQTNGTLLAETDMGRLWELSKGKLYVSVSLEGACARTHDALRGQGRFNQTLRGLAHLSRMGLGANTVVAFTETRDTISDLPDLLALVDDLGLGGVISGSLVTKGRAAEFSHDMLPNPDQYVALLNRYHTDAHFRDRYDRLGRFAAIEWYKGRSYPSDRSCRCMQSPYLTASGELFPCTMLPIPRWGIKDALRYSLDALVNEMVGRWGDIPAIYEKRTRHIKECQSCMGKAHCAGGCLGRLDDAMENFEGVEDRCALRKAVYAYDDPTCEQCPG